MEYLWLHACWCPRRAKAPYQVSDVGSVSLKSRSFRFTPCFLWLLLNGQRSKWIVLHFSTPLRHLLKAAVLCVSHSALSCLQGLESPVAHRGNIGHESQDKWMNGSDATSSLPHYWQLVADKWPGKAADSVGMSPESSVVSGHGITTSSS